MDLERAVDALARRGWTLADRRSEGATASVLLLPRARSLIRAAVVVEVQPGQGRSPALAAARALFWREVPRVTAILGWRSTPAFLREISNVVPLTRYFSAAARPTSFVAELRLVARPAGCESLELLDLLLPRRRARTERGR